MADRKIVAGALSIADQFELVGVAESVMVTLRAPDGNEFDIPMEIKLYDNIEEYNKVAARFAEMVNARQLP